MRDGDSVEENGYVSVKRDAETERDCEDVSERAGVSLLLRDVDSDRDAVGALVGVSLLPLAEIDADALTRTDGVGSDTDLDTVEDAEKDVDNS